MEVEDQAQPERWQPKITPYRLLILLTSIGLGGGKAYAVAQNLNVVSTCIEWIAGVLVFSTLFILGLCESDPPRLLKWLMHPDLVPIVFQMLSLNLPRYRSDEKLNTHEFPITGYRLLTSVSVTLFGTAKAYLTYRNEPGAANAFDWGLGIIIASSLYIIGLYENNSAEIMSSLFSVNYSAVTQRSLWLIFHASGICLVLIIIRGGITSDVIVVPTLPLSLTSNQINKFGMHLYFFGFIFLAPCSVLIVLSYRLLEFCLNSGVVPFLHARKSRTLCLKIGNFIYTIAEPLLLWPKCQINIPFLFPFNTMSRRVRNNGVFMLCGLTLSAMFMGLSFCLLALVVSISFEGSSKDDNLLTSYFLIPLVLLNILLIQLVSFIGSMFCLFSAVMCILVDKPLSFLYK